MTYEQKYRLKLVISYLFGQIFKTSGSRVLMYHSISQKIPEDKYNIYNLKKIYLNNKYNFLKVRNIN